MSSDWSQGMCRGSASLWRYWQRMTSCLATKETQGGPGEAKRSVPGEELFGAVNFWLRVSLQSSPSKASLFDLCSKWKDILSIQNAKLENGTVEF